MSIPSSKLSDTLIQECRFQFQNNWPVFAVQLAKWAADARDLESHIATLEADRRELQTRLALISEEG